MSGVVRETRGGVRAIEQGNHSVVSKTASQQQEVQYRTASVAVERFKGAVHDNASAVYDYVYTEHSDRDRYLIGREIIELHPAELPTVIGRLKLTDRDFGKLFADYQNRGYDSLQMEDLRARGEEACQTFMKSKAFGMIPHRLEALSKLEIKDKEFLLKQALGTIEEDSWDLYHLQKDTSGVKRLLSLYKINTDTKRKAVAEAVLKKNFWALPSFLSHMKFENKAMHREYACAWIRQAHNRASQAEDLNEQGDIANARMVAGSQVQHLLSMRDLLTTRGSFDLKKSPEDLEILRLGAKKLPDLFVRSLDKFAREVKNVPYKELVSYVPPCFMGAIEEEVVKKLASKVPSEVRALYQAASNILKES